MNRKLRTEREKIISFLVILTLLIAPNIADAVWPHETRANLIVRVILELAFFFYISFLVFPELLETRSKNIKKVIFVLSGLVFIMITLKIFIDYNKHLLTIVMVLLVIVMLGTDPSVRAFFARLRGATGHDSQRS